ncbi:MAG TPA: class I mannose-6-phosphate isomerase [Sphingomicrobium sp.]|nr:class I mannose-6-phosphate isomerase [Sphingomicrobium sp.]
MKLERHYVEKPWGRTQLPADFEAPRGKRIGEVWFVGDRDEPLLAKYLFASERLSIQVHPNDEEARERGSASGKCECWYIVDAEPNSTLGLGLIRETSADDLRAAALDGSIEQLIGWRPVRRGDFFLVPPGTIHAIGAGISLLEFQQKSDLTFRLYDYGRPRELHLDDAIAVACAAPYPDSLAQHVADDGFGVLADVTQFALAYTNRDAFEDRKRWVLPLNGEVSSKDCRAGPGDCLLLEPGETLKSNGATMLIGAKAQPS